jgi:Nif-specific regulatory protein
MRRDSPIWQNGAMAYLVVREPRRVPFIQALEESVDVGRDAGSGLVLADGKASRKHARFAPHEGGWTVSDLGSTHGTIVNHERVAAARLHEGDLIQIGGVTMAFHAGTPPDEDAVYRSVTSAETENDDVAGDARRLRVLFELSRAIAQAGDPDELLGGVLDSLLGVLGCERAVAELIDARGGGRRRIARARGSAGELVVSRAHLEAMLGRRESVLVRGAGGDAPPTLRRLGVGAAMGAPLVAAGNLLGFLYVDDRGGQAGFSTAELDFVTAIAHVAAAALLQAQQRQRATDLARALREENPTAELLGDSPPMQKLRAQLARYAAAPDAAVLILGESGTGKELAAATIHARSPRAEEAFVAVNCAAIPDAMVESELFGHERGAFTGAIKARRGKFALADGGTLFLDEIGDLSLAAQAKVLRAIEEGEILPLGGEAPVHVDVRVVSATHKRLDEEIAAGRFREDLYYRLSLGIVALPPLRARGDDVVLLANAFLRRAAGRARRGAPTLSERSLAILRTAPWPGNVRQLQNEIERALILCDGATIELEEPRRPAGAAGTSTPLEADLQAGWVRLQGERQAIDDAERRIITAALGKHGGVVARAARELGLPRTTLASRVQALGIETVG